MWTIAAVNKKFDGPLGSYNGLTDVHLAHYFSRPSRRSHLKAAKLITDDGFIIPEKNVKVELYLNEKKRKLYDILARSILQNAVHKEGSWNKKLCNYLEDISKMSAVDKARRTFKKKSNKVASELLFDHHVSSNHSSENSEVRYSKTINHNRKYPDPPYSAPVTCFTLTNDGRHKVANLKRCFSAKQYSPYVVPLLLYRSFKGRSQSVLECEKSPKQKKRKRKRSSSVGNSKNSGKALPDKNVAVPRQSLKFSQCKITLLYHGHMLLANFQKSLTQNILIKQQHCGGTPVVIYKGKISANEMLTFVSLDHEGYFFSIIVFLDGIRELKLSSCCVFRYAPGRRLGGTNGTFSVKRIEGGKPCLKCQYQELESRNFKDFSQISESPVNVPVSKENSVVVLDSIKDKPDDRTLDDVSEPEDSTQASIDALSNGSVKSNGSIKSVNAVNSADEEIEEILDDIHNQNQDKKDSSIEEKEFIVDETNVSSIEDEIKDEVISDHSSSPTNASEISERYSEPKKYHEVSFDSSSEDDEENQHVVTVSVHESEKD